MSENRFNITPLVTSINQEAFAELNQTISIYKNAYMHDHQFDSAKKMYPNITINCSSKIKFNKELLNDDYIKDLTILLNICGFKYTFEYINEGVLYIEHIIDTYEKYLILSDIHFNIRRVIIENNDLASYCFFLNSINNDNVIDLVNMYCEGFENDKFLVPLFLSKHYLHAFDIIYKKFNKKNANNVKLIDFIRKHIINDLDFN